MPCNILGGAALVLLALDPGGNLGGGLALGLALILLYGTALFAGW
jgi:hypothetical protein